MCTGVTMTKHTHFGLICAALIGLASPIGVTLVRADADPATAPTQANTAAEKPAPSVEVFPFTAISAGPVKDWTGRGIQENLQSDVSRSGATLALPQQVPAESQDALGAARQNRADLAVTGTYQIVGDQIRVNGYLTDVTNNKTLGGFSATGNQQDLFKVEDALGEQLRALLPRPVTTAQIEQTIVQNPPLVEAQQPTYSPAYVQAPDYSPAPTVNNDYATTPVTPYYYPDYSGFYSYSYPFGFYGGFGYVYSGRGYGYHDHGFGGRGYSGHFGGTPGFRGGGGSGGGSHGGGGFGSGFHGGGVGGGFHGGGGGGGRR
jgi:TolB-like protein